MTQNNKGPVLCPKCGEVVRKYRNPYPTVDVIVRLKDHPIENIVLIKRKNRPYGWALPGGFVDYDESVEDAAIREMQEELNIKIEIKALFGVYSKPGRDPRFHTITTVFTAESSDNPVAGDDAAEFKIFSKDNLPGEIAFDHAEIIKDYFEKIL